MIKTPLSTMIGGAGIWTPGATTIGAFSTSKTLNQLIKSLFANPEQGFAYDPNDLSTMWQDQAKLLPVTGEGQPVWHILDKSGNNNHAFAASSATRPILQRNATTGAYYLAFDGADDFLVTNPIDFTATDKVSLFAGVRKLGDAATGIICELSLASNVGSFTIYAPYDTNNKGYAGRFRGVTDARTLLTKEPLAPTSNVVSFLGTLGDAATTKLRVSGLVVSEMAGVANQGNLLNDNLYIGRRAGITHPFNGHLYNLIGIGRLTTTAETTSLEKLIAKNTGVTLSV